MSGGGGSPRPVGVVVMAYGTPASPDQVEAYYTHVRRGRPPSPEQLADLRRRYEAIGGVSPLLERTTAQVDALRAALGEGWAVTLGQKHAAPFVEDAVAALVDAGVGAGVGAGVDRLVGLVLAPHASALSTGEYHARAAAAAGAAPYAPVGAWHRHPALVELLAERVDEALSALGPPGRAGAQVVFSAHSLPERARDLDDPTYPDQLHETAAAVAERAGLGRRWRVAWQSAGRTPEPWIGPDILEVLRTLAGEGAGDVVVCPAGFVSDHLEVLYDIDVEAAGVAGEVGLRLVRTRSLNDDPRFVAVLADLVRDAAA